MAHDVIVVGAGIFGVTAALELSTRGRSVALIDPAPPHPDAASTDISKVIRAEYGSDVFYTELMERALVGWRRWNDAWFERPLFHETGFAILSSAPMRRGSFELESFSTLERRGHPVERLDAGSVYERFSAFRPGVFVDGYHNRSGGWAESGAVVEALLARALRGEGDGAGVELFRERAVEILDDGVRTTESHHLAERVVVAAGAWTQRLLPEMSARLVAVGQPVKHYAPSEVAPFTPPRFIPFAADIARTGWYGFSANADGIVKVANHGPGRRVDPEAPRDLAADSDALFHRFLARALPSLSEAPRVGERLCLYSDSCDGDLWIAPLPERPKVVVMAGGSGHGFKFAPVLGPIVADVLEGHDHPAAERFGWREPSVEWEEARHAEHDRGGAD